jgi:hypothetical protein
VKEVIPQTTEYYEVCTIINILKLASFGGNSVDLKVHLAANYE